MKRTGNIQPTLSKDESASVNGVYAKKVIILDASGKQVAEGRLLNSPKLTERVSLSYGNYSIIVGNAKTGYQEPKINLTLSQPEAVETATGESTFYATSNPFSPSTISSNIPLILIGILVVLLLVFFTGRSRDKKLKEITGEHPMRDSALEKDLVQRGEEQ